MANAIYPRWKEALLEGVADSSLDGVAASGLYAVLMNSLYVYDPAHEFFGSLTGVGSDEFEITNVTTVNGIVNGDDVTFLSVPSGGLIRAIVLLRRNTGSSATWRLVCYLDTGITGVPAVPNGNDIIINWHPTGIFGL